MVLSLVCLCQAYHCSHLVVNHHVVHQPFVGTRRTLKLAQSSRRAPMLGLPIDCPAHTYDPTMTIVTTRAA